MTQAAVTPTPTPRPRLPLGERAFWLIAPALVLIGVFLVLPYLNIVVMSLREPAVGAPYGAGLTVGNYTRILGDGYFLGVLADTLLLGVTTTVICLVLGYPLAYHLARTRSRYQSLLYVLVLSPLLVGVVVRSFGWLILLSGNGVVNRVADRPGPARDRPAADEQPARRHHRAGARVPAVHDPAADRRHPEHRSGAGDGRPVARRLAAAWCSGASSCR